MIIYVIWGRKQSARPPTTETKPNVELSYPTPERADGANHPAVVAYHVDVDARERLGDPRSRPARAVLPPTAHPPPRRHLLGFCHVDDHVTGTRTAPVRPRRLVPPPLPTIHPPPPPPILPRRRPPAAFDLAPATEPALALYNKDLDDPITDPVQALAVVFAVRASVRDVIEQIALFEDTCPAPVFPCDLSQLSTKTSTRISGPLKRCLPTLSETYGADPYAVQDILQSTSTCEAMLYANNARVKVDFKGPATFLNLVDDSIAALLTEIPEDALAAGKARFEACDLTVDPTAEGDLECRLGRAVASGARPTGGIG